MVSILDSIVYIKMSEIWFLSKEESTESIRGIPLLIDQLSPSLHLILNIYNSSQVFMLYTSYISGEHLYCLQLKYN
jgi:hypothetical protein